MIAVPQMNPETTPDASAAPIHRASAALSPAGNFVTKTAAKEMTPGTLRSRPPCWTTSVCPIAAVARIEAKQRTVNRAPADTLPGATTKLTTQRSTVAGTISMNCAGKILERLPIMSRGQEFP